MPFPPSKNNDYGDGILFHIKTPHNKKIIIHQGPAINSLETFNINTFDLAFIDADKINYLNYYKYCVQLVKKQGIIVLDNMLWGGDVLDPKDDDAKSLHDKLAEQGGKLVLETLALLEKNKLLPTPQDSDLAYYAPKLKKEESLLDWKMSANNILNKIPSKIIIKLSVP